jgi:hypothetical protein
MKTTTGSMHRVVFALAVLCTGLLAVNMAAMPIYKEQVFLQRGTIDSAGEFVILIGFLLVPVFNIVSLLWMASRMRRVQAVSNGDKGILALGVLCMILLIGEKVMVDEIGRETLLGWEVTGEWIILYIFLAIQLFYNFVILRRMHRTHTVQRTEAVA